MNDKEITKNLLKSQTCKNCLNLNSNLYGNLCHIHGLNPIKDLNETCEHWKSKFAYGYCIPAYTAMKA